MRDEIVRTCSRPVLVADTKRVRPAEFQPRCILVVEADSPTASRAKRFAAELANDYGAELVLLPADRDATGANDFKFAECCPGLIVAGVKRRGFRDLFSADCIERLLQVASVPIMVVPESAEAKNTITEVRGGGR
jgi:hypothetical protein